MRSLVRLQSVASSIVKVTAAYVLLAAVAFLLPLSADAATALYVTDPTACPDEDAQFPGQLCPISVPDICGVSTANIPQCYDNSTMVAPASSVTTDTQVTSTVGGGFIINCFADMDSAAPFCDNDTAAFCNRDASCFTTQFRSTVCTGGSFGAFTCGSCHSGRQDCDTSTAVCEVQTGITNYDNNGAGPTENNTNYGASCSAACDSGYLDCNTDIGTGGNGCEIQIGGVCGTGTGTSNAIYGSSCSGSVGNCGCSSGYLDCNSDLTHNGGACEIQVGGACGGAGANAIYGSSCSGSIGDCDCSSGYLDCNSDLTDTTGQCEIQVGASCGTNAIYGSSCNGSNGDCQCSSNYFDCDASTPGAGNGCEVQGGTACTTAQGATGTYTGCTCIPTKSYFETGVNSTYATSGALLDGTNLGTGLLIEMNNGGGPVFKVFNSGALQFGDFNEGSGTGAGTLRWTGTNFEGFDGSSWLTLSGPSQGLSDDRYVNVTGDTMTGSLTIGNAATLSVSGSIVTEGNITLNVDNAATDAVLTFGNDALAETLIFSDTTNRFEFSDDVFMTGDLMSSGALVVEGGTTLQSTLDVSGAAAFASTVGLGGVTYTFPGSDGSTAGEVLMTDAAGNLSWGLVGTGSLVTRREKIVASLSSATVIGDGSQNSMNVFAETETGSTSNIHHYLRAETEQGTLQDVDIRLKVQLPLDFVSFTSTTDDLQFFYRTDSASVAANKLDILVEDDDGDDAFTASDGQDLVSTTWTEYKDAFDGSAFNPVAGEYVYVTIKAYATAGTFSYAGEVVFTYTAR